jgi:hypothetical protein
MSARRLLARTEWSSRSAPTFSTPTGSERTLQVADNLPDDARAADVQTELEPGCPPDDKPAAWNPPQRNFPRRSVAYNRTQDAITPIQGRATSGPCGISRTGQLN